MSPGNRGIGGVFRDHTGKWVKGFIKICAYTNTDQSELLAMLYGLKIEDTDKMPPLKINSDSVHAISMLINDHLCYNNDITEYMYLMRKLRQVTIQNVYVRR